MTLYVIIAAEQNERLAKNIVKLFPDDYLELETGQWLISATGMTTKKISDEVGISDGKAGSGIVFATSGNYGRHNSLTWEWIASKLEE